MAILDGFDRPSQGLAGRLLKQAVTWLRRNPDSRLMLAGETDDMAELELPPELAMHDLLPVASGEFGAVRERLGFKEPKRDMARWPDPLALWAASGIVAPPWEQVRSLVGADEAQLLMENAARQVGGNVGRAS